VSNTTAGGASHWAPSGANLVVGDQPQVAADVLLRGGQLAREQVLGTARGGGELVGPGRRRSEREQRERPDRDREQRERPDRDREAARTPRKRPFLSDWTCGRHYYASPEC